MIMKTVATIYQVEYTDNARALDTLNDCMERGESRMRNFQRGLIRDGRKLKAFAFSKVMDIDHAEDIVKAELFLGQEAQVLK